MSIIGAVMVPHPPIIVPEIGGGEEKKIAKTAAAYRRAAEFIGSLKPDTIVLTSPHQVMYYDYFNIAEGPSLTGDFSDFRAPQVRFSEKNDEEFAEALSQAAWEAGIMAGTLGQSHPGVLDHGAMVPLYFIEKLYQDFRLVRIGLSGFSLKTHYKLGQLIASVSNKLDRRVVFVASGDLSHKTRAEGPYGFDPAGPEYDRRIMDVMGRGAFGELFDFSEGFCESAAECGHRSFVIMAGALDRTAVRAEPLSHEDVFGVGYGVCLYRVGEPDPSRNFLDQFESREQKRLASRREAEDPYVRLARASIESVVDDGIVMPTPSGLPHEMYSDRAGAFVSIHEDGRLRGCIGTITGVRENIAREIIENAVSAAQDDPRFDPIEKSELPKLKITVDILGRAEPVDSPDQLDPKRYGVIVSKDSRRGLLLPNLEGVDRVEDQISIARKKAGIGESEADVRLERFEVVRHY